MTPHQRSLFVYYKVEPDRHSAWVPQVRALQHAVQALWPQLQVELMQRPASSATGLETWMEVYRHPEGVSDAMIASIAQQALERALPAPRATELFIPLRD